MEAPRPSAMSRSESETEIGAREALVKTLVIHAWEDLEMARLATPLLADLHPAP